MTAVKETRGVLCCVEACEALGLSRATYYRATRKVERGEPDTDTVAVSRARHPRALTGAQRQELLDHLHSPRFIDRSVPQVYATLLDEGVYLASARTMYRILDSEAEVRERRNQVRRPNYAKPELLAHGPNEVWSWDITKLRGHRKWSYYYLYVLLDIFSRFVVGWMIARCESAALGRKLLGESVAKYEIPPGQLTCHSDRGAPMKAKSMALLQADLGITQSFNRPHVSNDNPFSEAHFKTAKYAPEYPGRFGSLEDARAWGSRFFDRYNNEHHHSGLGWMTPADVHFGRVEQVRKIRQAALDAAHEAHPERFVRKPPLAPTPPTAVWINPPLEKALAH